MGELSQFWPETAERTDLGLWVTVAWDHSPRRLGMPGEVLEQHLALL